LLHYEQKVQDMITHETVRLCMQMHMYTQVSAAFDEFARIFWYEADLLQAECHFQCQSIVSMYLQAEK